MLHIVQHKSDPLLNGRKIILNKMLLYASDSKHTVFCRGEKLRLLKC